MNLYVNNYAMDPSLGASDVDMSDDYDRLLLPRAPGGATATR